MGAPVQVSVTLQHDSFTEDREGSQTGTREGVILPLDSEIYMCMKWPRLHCPLSAPEPTDVGLCSFLLVPKCKHFKVLQYTHKEMHLLPPTLPVSLVPSVASGSNTTDNIGLCRVLHTFFSLTNDIVVDYCASLRKYKVVLENLAITQVEHSLTRNGFHRFLLRTLVRTKVRAIISCFPI